MPRPRHLGALLAALVLLGTASAALEPPALAAGGAGRRSLAAQAAATAADVGADAATLQRQRHLQQAADGGGGAAAATAAAAAAAAQQQRPQARMPPIVPSRCPDLPPGSTAAADAALAANFGVLWADLLWGIKKFGLEGVLRQASRGRVLVLPTNAALQDRFVPGGLYKQLGKIPARTLDDFRRFVQMGLAVKRSTLPAGLGCGLLYIAHEIGNPRRYYMVTRLPRPPGAAPAGGVQASAFGDWGTNQFSVLGQGYDVTKGLPISAGMSSLDPGFTLQPVFQLDSSQVKSLSLGGGSCTSQFSTSVYYSMDAFKQNIGVSLSLGLDFGIASLSANANFKSLSKTSSMSQTITTNSGAKIYLGGYGMASGPGGMTLHPAFISNARPLFDAARANTIDQYALQSFLDNYGTHFVNTVFWGGLAAVTSQMTASQYSSFQQTDVSVSVSAQVAMVQVNVNVDYSSTQTENVRENSQTFGEILIPSLVNITLFNAKKVNDPLADPLGGATYIDCVSWTHNVRTAVNRYGWRSPVEYKIAPLTSLFSYKNIWPTDLRNDTLLRSVRSTLLRFIQTCGYNTRFDDWVGNITANARYTACPAVDKNCVKGTYRGKDGICRTCYGDGTTAGPWCNSTAVFACDGKYCFCRPEYAGAAAIYNCVPPRNTDLVDVQEGQFGVATCPFPLVIVSTFNRFWGVVNADGTNNFGLGYLGGIVAREVSRRCQGHSRCVVEATNAIFGDPAFGFTKRLRFNWRCGYMNYLRVNDGQSNINFGCPTCYTIGQDLRPYWGKGGTDPPCNASDLYSKTASIRDNKQSASVSANTGTWGDPCGSANGSYYLGLHYTCTWPLKETNQIDASAADNNNIVLGCGCGRINEIYDATWTADKECGNENRGASSADLIKGIKNKCGLGSLSAQPRTGFWGGCTFNVTSTSFKLTDNPLKYVDDPCPGKGKTLKVKYTCW